MKILLLITIKQLKESQELAAPQVEKQKPSKKGAHGPSGIV